MCPDECPTQPLTLPTSALRGGRPPARCADRPPVRARPARRARARRPSTARPLPRGPPRPLVRVARRRRRLARAGRRGRSPASPAPRRHGRWCGRGATPPWWGRRPEARSRSRRSPSGRSAERLVEACCGARASDPTSRILGSSPTSSLRCSPMTPRASPPPSIGRRRSTARTCHGWRTSSRPSRPPGGSRRPGRIPTGIGVACSAASIAARWAPGRSAGRRTRSTSARRRGRT